MESVASQPYAPPVDQLLRLGETYGRYPPYRIMGFGPEQVPELIRLATDTERMFEDSDAGWAPIHAVRVIGMLRAGDAVEPLLALFDEVDDIDVEVDEVAKTFGEIGPPAIPPLVRYFEDGTRASYARTKASEALVHVARRFPETRGEIVAVLARPLDDPECRDDELNGFLVGGLMDLDAVEAAPAMERAFAEDRVDITIPGDWEDVQVKMGLIPARTTPRPFFGFIPGFVAPRTREADQPRDVEARQASKNASRAAAKRKAQKAARRKNRRRK